VPSRVGAALSSRCWREGEGSSCPLNVAALPYLKNLKKVTGLGAYEY